MKTSLPPHLRRKMPQKSNYSETQEILTQLNLSTVCQEAKCPNRIICFAKKRATFLALGPKCTRNCRFCSISLSKSPLSIDPKEPIKIAMAAKKLNLSHVVITMVTRDDLEDGGALEIAKILEEIRNALPKVSIEVLTSDFAGNKQSLDLIASAKPNIFNHNIETTRNLFSKLRPMADYDRSLGVLKYMKKKLKKGIKSGFMVGLGEKKSDVRQTLLDLFNVGCEIVTIGQYLQPTKENLKVEEFISISQFEEYKKMGKNIGIPYLLVHPYMRSSFLADNIKIKK